MAVIEQREFTASDGKKFKDKGEAEKHDALATARAEYNTALRNLNQRIAETTRTADGYLFQFGVWKTYYYVTPGFFDMPRLAEVPYLGWNWDLNEYDDAIEIVTRESNEQRHHAYKIGELYTDKKKGIAALIEKQKAWLAEREAQVVETEARFKRGEDPTRG